MMEMPRPPFPAVVPMRWIRNAFRAVCEDSRASRLVGAMVYVAQRHEQRQSQAQYRAIVENSADALALLDREGTIRFVTRSIERLSGYSAGEVVGSKAFDRIHPDDRAAVRDAFHRSLEQPGLPLSVQYRGQHKD